MAWADEYNTVYATPEQVVERHDAVMAACDRAGREPLAFSLMTGCLLGDDEAEVRDRAARVHDLQGADEDVGEWLDGMRASWVVGTVEQVAEQLDHLAGLGVDRVMLQHLAHDDLDMVALMGRLVR